MNEKERERDIKRMGEEARTRQWEHTTAEIGQI
jgi:hypothetical protein